MTTQEVAAALGLSTRTVQLQIKRGKIRARKVGRDYDIKPSEVDRYRRESLGQRQPKPA